jgi:hypothetical protein
MSANTFWNTITQPQPHDFPIWAVLDSDKIYTVELLREPVALKWSKIKAWQSAQIPEAPPIPKKERWEELADEYFQRKIETNNNILSSKDWFIEGVKYGRDQLYFQTKWGVERQFNNLDLTDVPTNEEIDRIKLQKALDSLNKNWTPGPDWQTGPKQACTTDEFKAKYGQHGESYKPQTDPNTPWNPKWDNQ